jgi:hypothetical protein
MLRTSLIALAFAFVAMPAAAIAQDSLAVTFTDPTWTGDKVPEGQQCPLQGGQGATPAMHVTGIPEGATIIETAYNDETYQPMNNGGHGILRFAVTPANGEVDLPSVPGNTADNLPEGVTVQTAARGTGDYASPGYLPPCSGGNGNTYSVTVKALDSGEAELAEGKVTIGKY